jgi:hypothetical protein
VKKRILLTIANTLFLVSATSAAQAEMPEISQTSWAVTKFPADNPNDPHARKIAFNSSREFKLMVDCDFYQGRYLAEDNSLRISSLTKIASDCDDESKNDAVFLKALLGVEHYEVSGNVLKLLTAKDELVVGLEPTSTFDVPSSKSKASKKHGKHQKAEKPQTAKAGKKGKKSKAVSKSGAAKTGVAKSSAAKGGSSKKNSPKQGKQH